jgi:transposase-like protein
MTIPEIYNKFPTEFDAIKYFEATRWGKKIICAYCGSEDIGIRNKDNRFHCKYCKKTFSVRTNTQLHYSKTALRTWLLSFAIVKNAKKGLSALQLKRDLGINYITAWSMYHKIRDLMAMEEENIVLSNVVETDTTTIDRSDRKCQLEKKGYSSQGGMPKLDKIKEKYEKEGFVFKEGDYKKPCKKGKQKTGGYASDQKITGAVQREGNVVAEVIEKTSFNEIRKLIDKHVDKNKKKTVLMTDEARENRKFSEIINHIAIDHNKFYSYRGLNSNTIESFWAIVVRQIKGSHHHVDTRYLHKYVAEAVFKFNNRKVDDMFETLVKFSMYPKKIEE